MRRKVHYAGKVKVDGKSRWVCLGALPDVPTGKLDLGMQVDDALRRRIAPILAKVFPPAMCMMKGILGGLCGFHAARIPQIHWYAQTNHALYFHSMGVPSADMVLALLCLCSDIKLDNCAAKFTPTGIITKLSTLFGFYTTFISSGSDLSLTLFYFVFSPCFCWFVFFSGFLQLTPPMPSA
jgi:hypothetical protein